MWQLEWTLSGEPEFIERAARAESVEMLGSSGIGKTSLLNYICTGAAPHEGEKRTKKRQVLQLRLCAPLTHGDPLRPGSRHVRRPVMKWISLTLGDNPGDQFDLAQRVVAETGAILYAYDLSDFEMKQIKKNKHPKIILVGLKADNIKTQQELNDKMEAANAMLSCVVTANKLVIAAHLAVSAKTGWGVPEFISAIAQTVRLG